MAFFLEYFDSKFKDLYQSSEVEDVFKRKAVEYSQCLKCCETSMKDEDANFIVDVCIPQNNYNELIDIQEIIMETFQPDPREKQCEFCDVLNSPHTMFLEIMRMPKILIVNMKKYQSGFQTKGRLKKLKCYTKIRERITLDVNEL